MDTLAFSHLCEGCHGRGLGQWVVGRMPITITHAIDAFEFDCSFSPEDRRDVVFPQQIEILADCTTISVLSLVYGLVGYYHGGEGGFVPKVKQLAPTRIEHRNS